MTMITPSYLGETIEYSSLHACRSTLEDPTWNPGPLNIEKPESENGSLRVVSLSKSDALETAAALFPEDPPEVPFASAAAALAWSLAPSSAASALIIIAAELAA